MTRLAYRFKNWRSVARLIWHKDVEGWFRFLEVRGLPMYCWFGRDKP